MNKKILLITLGLALILFTPLVGCTPTPTPTPSPSPTPTSAPGSISTSTGWTTFIIDDGLASNIVTSIIQDNQGMLWVASDQGLTRFNGSRWEIYTGSLSNTHITCATRDKQGNLWFGTVNAGAFKYTGKEWQSFNPSNTNKGLPGEEIASILADNQDNLWFANVGNVGQRTAPIPYGVTRYNGTDWTSFLDRTFVTTTFQDNQGNLWLGTNVGVTRYDGSGWQTFTTADGLTDNYVVAIAQDSQGNLWFGTWSGGVSRYDGKNWRTFTREDGLVSNAIHCILKDDQGNLWFGAYSIDGYNGISCFNGTEWQSFNPWQGRGNYNILSIFQDNAGNLWFATSIGLVRYSPDVVQPSALTSSTPTRSEVDLAYIQVSTGASSEFTDPIYEGIPVKVSCYDSKNDNISINNMNAFCNIRLYDATSKLVYNYQIIVNYMPNGRWDYVLWIPFNNFMPFYRSTSPYRKFEGSVKLVLTLPNHNPVEANNQVRLYLKGVEPISQKAYEATTGSPLPDESPLGQLDSGPMFPMNGTENVSALPTFTWYPISGATNFNFRIASDTQFTDIVDSKTGLPNIFSLTIPLDSGKTYFWEAQGVQRALTSDWVMFEFKTK